jgi:hypothetical protein
MQIYLINWNNFCYWNIAPNAMDFELKLTFLFKFESKRVGYLGTLCSLLQIYQCTNLDKKCSKLIYTNLVLEILQTDLQTMLFNLDDMYRRTLKIEEGMQFSRGLSVKQILEIC